MDWYIDSLLGSTPEGRSEALDNLPPELVTLLQKNQEGFEGKVNPKLPAEMMEMVKEYFEAATKDMPMGVEEAREHRQRLMRERTAFIKTAEEGWRDNSYSFCEH